MTKQSTCLPPLPQPSRLALNPRVGTGMRAVLWAVRSEVRFVEPTEHIVPQGEERPYKE